jgi:hypothetical protein
MAEIRRLKKKRRVQRDALAKFRGLSKMELILFSPSGVRGDYVSRGVLQGGHITAVVPDCHWRSKIAQ